MNKEKSEAIWIGATSNYRHKPLGLKWSNKLIKSLGIYIGTDNRTMINENFNIAIKKIENLLSTWNLRKMTIKGKIIIVNTLLLPQLLYVCTVMHTPQWVIEQYNRLIANFIWNGKPPKVKNTSLINTIENGGLKLQEIESKIKSLKLKWIIKMLSPETKAPWKSYLESYFNEPLEHIPYYNLNNNDYPHFRQPFYNELFKTWASIHYHYPKETIQICGQIIWKNSIIKIDGKLVNYKAGRIMA
jgi:hypothetical protein